MKAGRMQAKDVPDVPVLEFLEAIESAGDRYKTGNPFQRIWKGGEVNEMSVQHAMPDGTPYKVVLAKMGRLIDRGLVEGCNCGCAGMFQITRKGREHLWSHRTPVSDEIASGEAGGKIAGDASLWLDVNHFVVHQAFTLPVTSMTCSCVELAEHLRQAGRAARLIEIPGLNRGRPLMIKSMTRSESATAIKVKVEYLCADEQGRLGPEEGCHEFRPGWLPRSKPAEPVPVSSIVGVVTEMPGALR